MYDVIFPDVFTLCEEMSETAEREGSAAIVLNDCYTSEFIRYIVDMADKFGYISFDSYENKGIDYLVELTYENKELVFSLEPACSERGIYLLPESKFIFKHKDVPIKCFVDMKNNEFAYEDTKMVEFAFEDEICYEERCEICPNRFECPEYIESKTVTKNTVDGEYVNIIKDSDGKINGFTISKNKIDENGTYSSLSTNFFSDDITLIKSVATSFGIEI